jgi:hypothetical protein
MSDVDSVLNRIRQNRHRAVVPSRNDTLITQVQPTEASKGITALPEVDPLSNSMNTSNTLEELKAELTTIPETNRHSAIVLEKELDQTLTRYCKDNRVTVEVFLEAAWVYAAANPTAMEEILAEAKSRYADRKRAGKLRRLITMLESKS